MGILKHELGIKTASFPLFHVADVATFAVLIEAFNTNITKHRSHYCSKYWHGCNEAVSVMMSVYAVNDIHPYSLFHGP